MQQGANLFESHDSTGGGGMEWIPLVLNIPMAPLAQRPGWAMP